jgi:hypothetical protein
VPDVSGHGQADGFLVQGLGRCGATYTTAVLEAGVLGDGLLGSGGAVGKELAHPSGKALDVLLVECGAEICCAFAATGAGIGIGKTLGLCLGQGGFLDEDSLALVALASAAPPEHNGR